MTVEQYQLLPAGFWLRAAALLPGNFFFIPVLTLAVLASTLTGVSRYPILCYDLVFIRSPLSGGGGGFLLSRRLGQAGVRAALLDKMAGTLGMKRVPVDIERDEWRAFF